MHIEHDMVTITIENDIDEGAGEFDFQRGIGLGTGLTLIRSLLPGKGAQLSITPEDKRMKATLQLWSPVVRKANEQ